jgi:hypothetical protein
MPRRTRTLRLVVGIGLATVAAIGGVVFWSAWTRTPLPLADRCEASVDGATATVDPDQGYFAALISAVSLKRDLPPRAASIALATAFQESGLRNLDYGHADSLGLFQQRPSKGWGTEEEIMDPWYSAARFYEALVRVPGWKTGDINDVAQAVQRSAYPEAYRQHVPRARTLAGSLTGQAPASFSCSIARPGMADRDGMTTFLRRSFGTDAVSLRTDGDDLVVTTPDSRTAWAVAHAAVAGTASYGVAMVDLGNWGWTHTPGSLAAWQGAGTLELTEVRVVFATA